MAQPVTKWQGANGNLFDTEAEADQSIADDKELTALVTCFDDAGIYWRDTSPEECAIALLRFFTFTPRTPQ